MVSYILAILLVALVCLAITWHKVYFALPAKELKRRAEQGDRAAAKIWPVVAYGPGLRVFTWLVIGFASGGSFLLLARVAPPFMSLFAIVLLVWLMFAWIPNKQAGNLSLRLTLMSNQIVLWVVRSFDPVFRRIASLARTRLSFAQHTEVFEREDLIDLLQRQKSQPDSRISLEELDLAESALKFSDHRVRSAMVKRQQVKTVSADDTISPIFLDELHQTGHSRFPVTYAKSSDFVGVLHLSSLRGVSEGKGSKGKVSDHMQKGVVYIHEKDSLAQVLHAYFLTKSSLFVVINKFEDYVGILTIDDTLYTLLGKPGEHDFDQFDSKAAVAKRHTKKPKQIDEIIDEPAAESPGPDVTHSQSP